MMRSVLAALLTLITAGCAGSEARMQTAADIAGHAGLHAVSVDAPPFILAAFVRNVVPSQPVVVYIEGDGLAWASRSRPAMDPTPPDPVGLRLAAADTAPNVIHLARPCQYVRSATCDTGLWTGRRFSPEVIQAISTAIDKLILPGQQVHLVGYSGGGGVAALVAARRPDVLTLRTVAGNLDHEALTRYHRVSAMEGSLNPRDVAGQLARLPQIHYVGMRDEVVPPLVAESYLRATNEARCVSVVQIDNAAHADGWAAVWPSVAVHLPTCG